eukprot:TRINITY_DN37760_c0_g1_i1.p1 TRINITY_DN37760_c0_g1~~TRINITY_DN37760_c0_g1_i1.p1  ORF type:complete len:203 (-),score=53.47 TRINITY_DN37760_c0_g1_i1:13-621(-)
MRRHCNLVASLERVARRFSASHQLKERRIPVNACSLGPGFTSAEAQGSLQWKANAGSGRAAVTQAARPLEVFKESLDAERLISHLCDLHPVFILSKRKCPFCVRAKNLLEQLEVHFEVYELDELPAEAKAALQAHMKSSTGAGSVPRVFVSGSCLGGFSEVQRKLWAGELVPILEAAGALEDNGQAAKRGGAMFFEAGNPML